MRWLFKWPDLSGYLFWTGAALRFPLSENQQMLERNSDNPFIEAGCFVFGDQQSEGCSIDGLFDEALQPFVMLLFDRVAVFDLDGNAVVADRDHKVHFGFVPFTGQMGKVQTGNTGQKRSDHTFGQKSRYAGDILICFVVFNIQIDVFLQPT